MRLRRFNENADSINSIESVMSRIRSKYSRDKVSDMIRSERKNWDNGINSEAEEIVIEFMIDSVYDGVCEDYTELDILIRKEYSI